MVKSVDELIKLRENIQNDLRLSESQKQRLILQVTNEMLKLYNIEMNPGTPWFTQEFPPETIPELENMLDNL